MTATHPRANRAAQNAARIAAYHDKQEAQARPDAPSELDKFFGPRPAPPPGYVPLANATAKDFDPTLPPPFSREEFGALSVEIATLCGLVYSQCLTPTVRAIKAAAKFCLFNVTCAEANIALEELRKDAKGMAWWRANGSPMAAAKKIVEGVSRLKSQAGRAPAVESWTRDAAPVESATEAERVRKALSWTD